MADGERLEGSALFLAEARWRRDDQNRRHDVLNQRLSTMFALNFAVLAILGASLSFSDVVLPVYVESVAFATIFLLLVNIAILMWAFRVERLTRRPDLRVLLEVAVRSPAEVASEWYGKEIELALEANEQRLDNKSRLIATAMATSSFTVLMVAAVAALALHHG